MSIHAKKVPHRKDILCGRYKKDKKKTLRTKSILERRRFVFFTPATKNVFSSQFFCTNIECSNVHPKFLFEFLDILKSSLIHFKHRIEGFKSKNTRTIQKLSTTVSVIRKLHLTTHTLNLIPQPSCFPRQRSPETKTAFS